MYEDGQQGRNMWNVLTSLIKFVVVGGNAYITLTRQYSVVDCSVSHRQYGESVCVPEHGSVDHSSSVADASGGSLCHMCVPHHMALAEV
jgi:hypothetical protein